MSRGRGRGRGKPFGGNLELLGLSPGQPAPPPILQPPPDFPPLDRKPLQLRALEVDEYHLTVKQEFREQIRQSQFYLKAGSVKKEIEKYSDRYQSVKLSEMDNQLGWEIDWNYYPEELRIEKPNKKKKWQTGSKYSPTVTTKKRTSRKRSTTEKQGEASGDLSAPAAKRKKRVSFADDSGGEEVGIDTEKKLNELERLESSSSGGGGVGDGAASEEEELMTEDEHYDEEVEEEGTDYNLTYFDNGEDYLAGEEDTLEDNEGPYY
jgi:DNA-directed RNA polymerase III subunit RPC7